MTASTSGAGPDEDRASRLFDELNRRYWRGRLPRYRIIRRAGLRAGLLGQCRDRTRTILLAPHATLAELRDTLLHEMCHIGTGPGDAHGPRFIAKVRCLVKRGESKLLEDVERYDGTAVRKDRSSDGSRPRDVGDARPGGA